MTAAAVILFMAASCSYRVERNPFFDEKSAPARPCVLLSDTTLLVVRDYFPGIDRVDGMTCDDYTVVPLSPDSMDTVLVVAGPASRNISTVRVTTGEESGVIVLKREYVKSQTVPEVTVVGTDMGGREFTVKVDNTPASYLVLWQNTLLGHKYLSYRKSGVFTVHVPSNAAEMGRSYIRIYSHNAAGAGSGIVVPVQDGRVVLSEETELS